jgi:hypothetical protein
MLSIHLFQTQISCHYPLSHFSSFQESFLIKMWLESKPLRFLKRYAEKNLTPEESRFTDLVLEAVKEYILVVCHFLSFLLECFILRNGRNLRIGVKGLAGCMGGSCRSRLICQEITRDKFCLSYPTKISQIDWSWCWMEKEEEEAPQISIPSLQTTMEPQIFLEIAFCISLHGDPFSSLWFHLISPQTLPYSFILS